MNADTVNAKPYNGTLRVFVTCQVTLVDTYRTLVPELDCDGNRAVIFHKDKPVRRSAVAQCFDLALTYHLKQRR